MESNMLILPCIQCEPHVMHVPVFRCAAGHIIHACMTTLCEQNTPLETHLILPLSLLHTHTHARTWWDNNNLVSLCFRAAATNMKFIRWQYSSPLWRGLFQIRQKAVSPERWSFTRGISMYFKSLVHANHVLSEEAVSDGRGLSREGLTAVLAMQLSKLGKRDIYSLWILYYILYIQSTMCYTITNLWTIMRPQNTDKTDCAERVALHHDKVKTAK